MGLREQAEASILAARSPSSHNEKIKNYAESITSLLCVIVEQNDKIISLLTKNRRGWSA